MIALDRIRAVLARGAALVRPPATTLGAGIVVGLGLGMAVGDGPEGVGRASLQLPPLKSPMESGAARPSRQPAWRRYAVSAPDADAGPMIAIVIDDVGVDKARSMKAIALDAPLTVAMLPYAHGLEPQMAAARAAGHEIIVHIPMEPHDADADPGPHFLAMAQDEPAFRRTLAWNLARLGRYVGFSNHMGSRYTEDPSRMRRLMREARKRGLLFLDSMTSPDSVAMELAEAEGVPAARRDVFLDNERRAPDIRRRLAELEEVARRKGFAVGIGHPHDVTVEVLAQWIPEARRRGFALVPISAVVRHRFELARRTSGQR